MKIQALEFRLPKGTKTQSGKCAACGCTDERACTEGCWWVDTSHVLCSACIGRALDAVDLRARTEVSRVSDMGGDYVAIIVALKRTRQKASPRSGKEKRP